MDGYEFEREVAEDVERTYRRAHPHYALEKDREELEAWMRENRDRLEAARYEPLSPAYQRKLAERRAVVARAKGLMAQFSGVLYGPAGLRLGSPADPDRVEAIKRELERTTDVPPGRLEALVDGVVARIEAGDGRGARELLQREVEALAAAGAGVRPEAREELDPQELAKRIPRRTF